MLRDSMRRLLAITLTLLFGLTLAAPMFPAGASSNLPSCCRRNGDHHCMSGMSDGSRAFSSIARQCQHFPRAIAVPLTPAFAPAASQSADTLIVAHPQSAPQTEARYRVAYARSRQKRGPPVILL
jgi:hypothetical protein